MARSKLWSSALQLGRHYAGRQGRHFCAAFDTTPAGDAARVHVRRALRKRFPGATNAAINTVIREGLTP